MIPHNQLPPAPGAPFSSPPPTYHPSALPQSPMQASFKVDEGYSEETRSQPGSDSPSVSTPSRPTTMPPGFHDQALPPWIMALPEAARHELAFSIIRTLRTSSVARLVDRLHPFLHLDPITHLPPELAFHVFSFLDPATLLVASNVSRPWRSLVMDSRLWMQMYRLEGWRADQTEVRRFAQEMAQLAADEVAAARKARMVRSAVDADSDPHASKRRVQDSSLFGGMRDRRSSDAKPQTSTEAVSEWSLQHGPVESEPFAARASQDEEMLDVDAPASPPPRQSLFGTPDPFQASRMDTGEPASTVEEDPQSPPSKGKARAHSSPRRSPESTLIQPSRSLITPGSRSLNWMYLYKQRKRLEDNWNAGRYVNFQLPHPDHPEEGHQECIYTIQYSGKHLVSGSRDQSLRIWNLETRRLVRKPLVGHHGSVLCLQFDASPEEDIIISGSSDTQVIIWKFSTGEKIRTIKRAHRESVLNLRFDKRYLITCSKDKTIHVWNRQELRVIEKQPRGAGPRYTFDMFAQNALGSETRLANGSRAKMVPPWTVLITLEGHNAAVNAIQVYGDQIVSASGDRSIKVWNLRTGQCIMSIPGHGKGIACVQFDGRRIVSGSSDNCVKIFDRATGAQVACLKGHECLVRTVQAGFGDIPGSEEDLEAEARAVDRMYFEARDSGIVTEAVGPRHGVAQSSGSRDPRNMSAFGAKLPPGGGGSRWGRIVSGSYDETVIIWKRDQEGKWVVGHRLRQDVAARAASGQLDGTTLNPPAAAPANPPVNQAGNPILAPANHPLIPPPQAAAAYTAVMQAVQTAELQLQQASLHPELQVGPVQQQLGAMAPDTPSNTPSSLQAHQSTVQNSAEGVPAVAQSAAQGAVDAVQQGNAFAEALAAGQPFLPPQLPPNVVDQNIIDQHLALSHQVLAHPLAFAEHNAENPPNNVPQQVQGQNQQQQLHQHYQQAIQQLNQQAQQQQQQHQPQPQPQPQQPQQQQNGGNARVFKLQFDARRIICCSQDPRIVGWDFANDDPDIVEASRFFSGME
ncbi:MAG: hypothetical protein M4579_000997 [Chaenotheca gracillima]|nr:MAG: hypothetical protein M4579_000997 [Chaenotheca gracillima]